MTRLEFRSDRQFLPAALEVLETPSSPTRRKMLLTLCLFVTLSLVWAFVGRVDIEAVAKGKIEPRGRIKVVEPLEPGRVSRIFVTDGAQVRRGDPLVEFDPTEIDADAREARQSLAVDLADAERYRAAVASASGTADLIDLHPAVIWDGLIPVELRGREEHALLADLSRLTETLRNFDMQVAERHATLERLNQGIAADEKLVTTLQERVTMRETLVAHDAGTRSNLIDGLQDLEKAQSTLIADQGARGEAKAALNTLGSSKSKAAQEFIADNTSKLDDAANKAVMDKQNLAKAEARFGRTRLMAPVDGIVQKLAVTTVGQVVTTGQDLMNVVPSDEALDINAFIENGDIGFVRPGQEVVVKLDAFPFTRYGTMRGKVLSIATDAIDEGESRRMQANTANLVNSAASAGANEPQGQRFVFPIVIALEDRMFRVGSTDVPLTAGMSVTAEIRTDRQRIIDYVLSPLTQTVSEAMHER